MFEHARANHPSLRVAEPFAGEDFDFDSLAEIDFLIVSTSSWFGFPPANARDFAHQLLLTAETNPGSLSHLQHAVWGNGHPKWYETFMNMPRYLDQLLETAGSRRFFARGESGEPHAACGADACEPDEWTPRMWDALRVADRRAPPVPWDDLWKYQPSRYHHDVVEWTLRDLVRRHGALDGAVSALAKPDDAYFQMLEAVAAEIAAEQAAFEEQRRRRAAARATR